MLYNIFANPDFTDPQKYEQLWAVEEITRRVNLLHTDLWKMPKANKKHECTRGCEIKPEEHYLRYDDSFGSGLKFCVPCASMIFYFAKYHELPVFMHDHWDIDTQRPVCLNERGSEVGRFYEKLE